MTFTNDPTDCSRLIATDYWETPEAEAGQPVIHYSDNTFRLMYPLKRQMQQNQMDFAPVLRAIEASAALQIGANATGLLIDANHIVLCIQWAQVKGLTYDQCPKIGKAVRLDTYVFAGKRGPRRAFTRPGLMRSRAARAGH